MSMRDEIVQLIYENLWQDEWNQLAGGGDAADAIMANQQARIDELEQGLRDIKDYALGRATAALKGSDT